MKAVIMAGGDGKRLRPITCTMPKPLVPLLNRPVIEYSLDLLKKNGFTEVTVTVHYLPKEIEKRIGNGKERGMDITYADPGKRIGTAGSLRFALKDADEPVLILSGDGITDIDLTDLVEKHNQSNADATVALKCVNEPSEYGVALLDRNGFINRFIEKPDRNEVFSDYANMGIYILEPQALRLIPKDTDFDIAKDLFPLMLKNGMKLFGYKTDAYWCDIGHVSEFRKAQYDLLDKKCSIKTSAELINGALTEPGARISSSAKLMHPCYIGKDAVISSGAVVGPYSVIGSGAVIGEHADIKRSIVFPNSIVRSNCELRECVICENAQLDNGATVYSEAVIGACSIVGRGARIYPNALIWPCKTVDCGADCYENIIWGGMQKNIEFCGNEIKGPADTGFTPETAARLGASIGAQFKSTDVIGLCTDGRPASVVLKSALESGINSQGIDTVLHQPQSAMSFMYAIRSCGYDGGIYIMNSEDREVSAAVFDQNGVPAASTFMRAIKQKFDSGENRPTITTELGIQSIVSGLNHAYENHLSNYLKSAEGKSEAFTLYLGAPVLTFGVIERILTKKGWNVIEASDSKTEKFENDISIYIDEHNSLTVYLPDGSVAEDKAVKTVLAEELINNEKIYDLLLPASLDECYRRYLSKLNCECKFVKDDLRSIMIESESTGIVSEPLWNPEAAVVVICSLFKNGKLGEMILTLPTEFKSEKSVQIPYADRGRLLRSLAEEEHQNAKKELIDGYRLSFDSGWVAVRPENFTGTSFKITAGSADSEYAEELCDIYLDKLKAIRDNKQY